MAAPVGVTKPFLPTGGKGFVRLTANAAADQNGIHT
jgi:hypothetical protein